MLPEHICPLHLGNVFAQYCEHKRYQKASQLGFEGFSAGFTSVEEADSDPWPAALRTGAMQRWRDVLIKKSICSPKF